MKIAIILHMGPNGLGILRGLAKQGIKVFGVDFEKDAIGFSSKYCDNKLIFPHPTRSPKECLDHFIELGKTLGEKAVLLPAADFYVEFMSKFETELSDFFLFNIPSPVVLDNLADKSRQYKLAERIGIPPRKLSRPKM